MSVSASIAIGPNCFMWKLDVLLGPVAGIFFRVLIEVCVTVGVKGKKTVVSGWILCGRFVAEFLVMFYEYICDIFG